QYIDDNFNVDIFLRDNTTGTTQLITRADGQAVSGEAPTISADGHYIAFESGSTKFTPQLSDLNNGLDVFVYDRVNDSYQRVSIPPSSETHDFPGQFGKRFTQDGAYDPHISADGKRVIFAAGPSSPYWNNARDVYLRDIDAGQSYLLAKSTATDMVVDFWIDDTAKRIAMLHMGPMV